jgi:hypothetical protein
MACSMLWLRAGLALARLAGPTIFMYWKFMASSVSRTEKKVERRGRGRPRSNPTSIHLTLLPPQLEGVDSWIERQGEPDLSRPEAIRRLLDRALAAESAEAGSRPAKRESE